MDPVRQARRRHRVGERDELSVTGELLLYPGGVSETELLFPYGPTCFASKAGQLAGNHFATIVDGADRLQDLGDRVLWQGAQPISFRET